MATAKKPPKPKPKPKPGPDPTPAPTPGPGDSQVVALLERIDGTLTAMKTTLDTITKGVTMASDIVVKLQATVDKLDKSFEEVAKEVQDINSQTGNSAEDKAALAQIQSRVDTIADKFSNLIPDSPTGGGSTGGGGENPPPSDVPAPDENPPA